MLSEALFGEVLNRTNLSSEFTEFSWVEDEPPHCSELHSAIVTVARSIQFLPIPLVVLIGPDGRILPNPPMKALLSPLSREEIIGRSILKIVPHCKAALERVYSGSNEPAEEAVLFSLVTEGSTRWFQLDFAPITNDQGAVVGAQGVATEVTSHTERIRELLDTEQQFRLALETSGMVGIWQLDVHSNLCKVDGNVARMYRLTSTPYDEAIELQQVLEAIHPDDQEEVIQSLRIAIDRRVSYRCKHRVVSDDNRSHWVMASGTPCYNEAGELTRILGVVVEVTDQVETALALQQSRFAFETLTETLPQIVWSCDAQGRHDYFSRRLSEFTGIPQEEITEEVWKQLVYEEHQEMVSKVWSEVLREGKPYDIDYRFRHHSGEYRWLRVMALPIRDEEGRITRWFGTSTDIHESCLIAGEREKLAKQLERLATEDQLTEALTRRAFVEQATASIVDAEKQGMSVGLIMLDVDHFKSINDTFGHPAGDKVLSIIARRIKASVAKHDLFGRLGGEEFSILLRNSTAARAQRVAERVRQMVLKDPIVLDSDTRISVTISVGVTTTIPTEANLDRLLLVADKALYLAKASGRNRTVYLSPE